MLVDYLGVVAPVVSIVGSVIAVAVSHFKPEDRRIKITLLIAAIVLGLVAAVATIYGQTVAIRKQTTEASDRAQIRERLGGFIGQAEALIAVINDPSQPLPKAEAETEAWLKEVEDYLREKLGPGYVERFRSSAGAQQRGHPLGISGGRLGYWNGVFERSSRLQQFSSEIGR
jgi:hypothetical protein